MIKFKDLPEEVKDLWESDQPGTSYTAHYCETLLYKIERLEALLKLRQELFTNLVQQIQK